MAEVKTRTGMIAMISALAGTIVAFLVIGQSVTDSVSQLVTEDELTHAITQHASGVHTGSARQFQTIQDQVNDILLLQLEQRIETTVRIWCQNPSVRAQLDETIRDLIRRHNSITGRSYPRPTCTELGI